MAAARHDNVKFAAALLVLTLAAAVPALGGRLMALAGDLPGPDLGPYISDSDFVNYWMGPLLALQGEVGVLFDIAAYQGRLEAIFGPDYPPHNWSYPPHALLILWPLALLPYKAAMAVFLCLTLAAFLLAAEAFRRRFAPQASAALMLAGLAPFILVNLASTQNGFLTGALILGFFVARGDRPALAGLLLALLTTKPQLGILIPFLLAFDRQWRTMAWAVLFTLVMLALTLAAFGAGPWLAYLSVTMPFQHEVMTTWEGIMLVMMPTLLSALRILGVDSGIAQAWQTAFSLACLPFVLWLLWRLRAPDGEPAAAALALTAGTVLVAPYSFNYDMGALAAVASAMFAREAAMAGHGGRRLPVATATACLVLCLLPLLTMLLGLLGLPLAPLLAAICFAATAGAAAYPAFRSQAPA